MCGVRLPGRTQPLMQGLTLGGLVFRLQLDSKLQLALFSSFSSGWQGGAAGCSCLLLTDLTDYQQHAQG